MLLDPQGVSALVIHADIILPDLQAIVRILPRLLQKEVEFAGFQGLDELGEMVRMGVLWNRRDLSFRVEV